MGRVAALVCHFFPDDLVAIKAAVLHDMGEAAVGDMSHKVKKKYPELREILHQAEVEALADLNIEFPELTEEQAKRVYFCDQLDALMWAYLKHPWLSEVELWQTFENWVASMGKELGVEYDLSKCAY
jgi:5'-deoxynucleotidase YfbR-like HD superfamily hydrolase